MLTRMISDGNMETSNRQETLFALSNYGKPGKITENF